MRAIIISLGIAALLLAPAEAAAPRRLAPQPLAVPASGEVGLVVEAGSGRVVPLPAPVANVFVSDPKIAEVRPASPTSLFLFGVAAGHTSVAALDGAGKTIRLFQVTVRPTSYGASEAAASIDRTAPGANVRIEAQPKRLVLQGHVATPADAQAASTTTSAFLGDGQTVDNRLRVNSQIQVGLRVRIAEMSRSVTRALGVNWQAMGQIGKIATTFSALNPIAAAVGSPTGLLNTTYANGNININNLIDALAGDNLIHVLAEPNLVAMSGEAASFLVGGEFPIPVSQQNNTITVDYKQFGVSLSFVPTVMSEDRIRLHVRPEVSELSTNGAVSVTQLGGASISIPALTVRRADTTVELGSGQSFAIAGLLQDTTNDTVSALPGLGELPILGALFRSDSFLRQETELVIIVTPYIMRPVNDPTALRLSTDGFRVPNDLERLLLLRQTGIGSATAGEHVPGQAGFVVQ
jgi:pilus assembly protein CpaC